MQAAKIRAFTDLKAWQEGHVLMLAVYEATRKLPVSEKFGLIPQMQRSASSIPANLAEGFSRQTYPDKIHFYSIAHGSLTELQSQLIQIRDLQYLTALEFNNLGDQAILTHKLISGLIKSSKLRILNS